MTTLCLRDHQVDPVDEIERAFTQSPVVVLDAPPGSGKTFIAEAVRRCLGVSALYLCSTKTLQAQVARDFPDEAKVLMGRGNYQSQTEGIRCDACTKGSTGDCWWCDAVHRCPYEVAKREALAADLTVTNYAYFFNEANTRGLLSKQQFIIADEADLIENELLRYVSVSVPAQLVSRLKLGRPKHVTKEESWVEWITGTIPTVTKYAQGLQPKTQSDWRHTLATRRLADRLPRLVKEIQEGEWVLAGSRALGAVVFRPVTISHASSALWRHSAKWLLMSGTVLSAPVLLDELGWTGQSASICIPSIFPPERRQVKLTPIADFSAKRASPSTTSPRSSSARERPDMRAAMTLSMSSLMARHPAESILIHSVSYALTEQIAEVVDKCGRKVYTYSSPEQRDKALRDFRRTPGSVLVAPSMDRGVDLPDDLCRVQVVAKVPYPYLGDRQVSARLHSRGGQLWYDMATARSVVQMSGRAIRHDADWAVTYVLDEQFIRFYRKCKWMFPQWWRDGLDWRDRLPIR